jgi:hypothetical protein
MHEFRLILYRTEVNFSSCCRPNMIDADKVSERVIVAIKTTTNYAEQQYFSLTV